MLTQLDSENGDYDLTSIQTVLTDTPDAANPMLCMGYVVLGDGAKDLDGSGGDFELTVSVGGQAVQPAPQTVTFGTDVRAAAFTLPFPVPANAEVLLRIKSPNATDTDVDVTAYLYDMADKTGMALSATGLDTITATAPGGVASNFREMMVQLWRRFFRKSTLTSSELKTYADNGTDVETTQTVSDDGTTQTQGAAS